MKHHPLLLWLVAGLCGFLLVACATPVDTAPAYAAHLTRLADRAPHVAHQVQRADGLRIAVREFGLKWRGQGPTLVLMHGFPDNQHLYDAVIPQLAQQHHVLSFDFLGWGDSEKPSAHRYDVASQRADLDALVKHFALNSVLLVVHDLSGQVGMDWALDNEPATAGLVLLNTYYQDMPTLKAPPAIQAYATPGVKRDLMVWGSGQSSARFKAGVASQLGAFFSQPAVRDAYVPVLSHRAAEMLPAFISSTSVLWAEVAARSAQVLRMRAFQKPVWVVFGADDPYLNAGVAREFQTLFPNGRLHLLSAAGHYVQLDAAERVSALIGQAAKGDLR
jgi:haloalkane dehalogenase